MQYTCEFEDRLTGERRTILASLTLAECASLETLRKRKGTETAAVVGEAYALSRGYRLVPPNFFHVEPPKLQLVS